MGQQQLLLLVLGIVLVGLAVVVGLDAYAENTFKSEVDSVTSEGVRIAAELLAWRLKPAAFAGGDDARYLNGASFTEIGTIASGAAQTTSNTPHFNRSIASLTTNRPYVQIQSKRDTNVYIRVYLYGPSQECLYVLGRRRNASGAFVWDTLPSYNSYIASSAGCGGW